MNGWRTRLLVLFVPILWCGAARPDDDTLKVPQDYASIQKAIDAAEPGDIVQVSAGTYRERLRLKPGVTLRSAGDDARGETGLRRAETTILDGGGGKEGPAGVVLAERAVLDGFTVTRVGTFDPQEFEKHYKTHGEHLPDERGAAGTDGNVPAVSVAGVTAIVRNCVVRDNGSVGIGCTAADGRRNASLITKNVVFRNMGGGIGIASGATPVVSGNRCSRNLRGGIGNRASAAMIVGNECFDNVRAGIGIREGARPIVRRNTCRNNRRAGIGIRMPGTAPLVEDNDCFENAMAGIGCRNGARPILRGNRCYRNTLAGIGHREGADSVIEGNHVHHNKAAGIGFSASPEGRSVVLNNKVHDNGRVAIAVQAGWKVRFSGNDLSGGDGMPPIVMVFKGAEADFSDNRFKGAGVAAIRTAGTVRAASNTFECSAPRRGGPPSYAVWGLPGSRIEFTGNTSRGWRHGIFAEEAAVTATSNSFSGYGSAAVRIRAPKGTAVISDNVFTSKDGGTGVSVTEGTALIDDNRVVAPEE